LIAVAALFPLLFFLMTWLHVMVSNTTDSFAIVLTKDEPGGNFGTGKQAGQSVRSASVLTSGTATPQLWTSVVIGHYSQVQAMM